MVIVGCVISHKTPASANCFNSEWLAAQQITANAATSSTPDSLGLQQENTSATTESTQSVIKATKAARKIEIRQAIVTETFSEWYAKKTVLHATYPRDVVW